MGGIGEMIMNDLFNALFELGGAIVVWINVVKLAKDKKVMGVFWPVWLFYTLWGLWNLYYYPSLSQHLSFWAGLILVIGNTFWCCQAFYYEVLNKRGKRGE